MELADVTDSKSVGSNTVRVRPPPSAPKSVTPLNEWGYTFCVLVGGENPQLAGKAWMLTSNNLYNFSSNVLTNYNNILQNPFKFVILYQKTKRPITS